MIPILYEKDAVSFDHNGIGPLRDTISFKVKDERNTHPELTFQYPIFGIWYNRITEGSIVKGKANDTSELQLFRIYKSSKPLNGVVTFYAKHISCDLKGIPIRALSMKQVAPGAALSAGFEDAVLPHRFAAWSDITTLNDINIQKPRSLRNFCGGEAGSVLEIWGGEYEFDNFTVKLHKSRGADHGVVINYGKNLTDAKQERNISECYTHFYPYAVKRNDAGGGAEQSEEIITLSAGAIELLNPENIGHTKALTLDITDLFAEGEEITEANLRTHADEYIAAHKLGVPDVNITLSYVQIWDSPEYSNIAELERVALCDMVTVRFLDLGIDAKAKIIATEYDGLAERFTKIEIGDPISNFAETFVSVTSTVKESEKVAFGFSQSIKQNAENVAKMAANLAKVEGKIPTKTSQLDNDSNFATTNQIPDVTGFATENFVKNEIANAQLGGDDSEIDLSGYATKDDLKAVENKIPDISDLATKDELEDVESKIPDTSNLATKQELSNLAAQIPTKTSDLENDSDFATKEEVSTATKDLATKEEVSKVEEAIPEKTSQLKNDSGFMTESEVEKLVDDKLSTIEVENGSVVYDRVVDEERKIYYAIDTYYLARNGSMSLKDQNTREGLEIRSVMSTNGATFPLIIESNRGILEIVIVTQNNDKLTVIDPPRGIFENIRGSWVFTPLKGDDVTMVNIVSASNKDVIVQLLVITE